MGYTKDTHSSQSRCDTLTDNKAGASEPAYRGIGVSVAVVGREIISKLRAWDAAARCYTELTPGQAIFNYHIQRHSQAEIDGGAEPYVVLMESNGRKYWCALTAFQARTQAMEPAHAADAIAV
jgi:hypothetical protein